jgi:hypothetical protein
MGGQSLPEPGDATVPRVAPVAQGIERAPPERKVVGSIPTGRILTHEGTRNHWRVSRPSPWGITTATPEKAARCDAW